jgi:hypothetical protein
MGGSGRSVVDESGKFPGFVTQHPPLTPARIAGPPPSRSVAAARQTGAEGGGLTPDVWEGARDFF